LKRFQEKVYDAVAKQVEEWGIEKNEKGWMAKYYLYCNEAICPHCKSKVPLAPSWWISKKTKTIAVLKYNPDNKAFDIEVIQSASKEQIEQSEKSITVKGNDMFC